ncbi:MAG: hypothetical protein ACSHW6_08110 [Sulfitobacter geojensis]
MITLAPLIPQNLKKKLETAVKSFQREYDELTIAEARRLLAGHSYKMPVLGRLEFHKNGTLKSVILRENQKRQDPQDTHIGADLTIFGRPSKGVRDLWSPFLRWIVAEQVKKNRDAGWYETDKLSNDDLRELLRQLPTYQNQEIGIQDASALMLRKMVEIERDARQGESNHQALQRLARPVPPLLIEGLRVEREAALRWFDDETAQGYSPVLRHATGFLPKEERIVLSYRGYHDKN